ncbi:hypothetical protein [Anditalea andensis]|uniref:Dihydrolipoamide dehydrogenase n=1 Tax=Anditalea andensis TaxID=1048983 RepID=A0A074LHS5_9BACT|nr:hypothetical protein [Anditalea andensis]KEO73347.1 hypothetical protein EL17_13455 [Anditalea andensis]
MKKTIVPFLFLFVLFIQACEGPIGREGPQGPPGPETMAETLEVELDFTAFNDFQEIYDFEPPIFDDDIVLGYIRWEIDPDQGAIWRPLPETVFFEKGVLQYKIDFTSSSFRLFLESTFNPELLESEWLENQYFRIVIIPSVFVNPAGRVDYTNLSLEDVLKLIGKTEADFKKIEKR